MKRTKSVFLLALLMSMTGIRVNAHSFAAVNNDGVTIYYQLINGEAWVSYQGNSYTHYENEYTGTIVIPEYVSRQNGGPYHVTGIWPGAFRDCSGVTSVTIPNSVTTIGQDAFSGTDIYVNSPDGVYYVDQWACGYKGTMPTNTAITTWAEGIRGIADGAFAGCTNLSSITIPNVVTGIGPSMFNGCTGLKNVTIPNTVIEIGSQAFNGCTSLTSVDIPNSVLTIRDRAFLDCTGLATISFPMTLTNVGQLAFYNTAWYNEQPDGLVYAGSVAYKYKGTMPSNTTITLSDGTLGIAEEAFEECTNLKSVTIPNSLTNIGGNAFYGCTGLTCVDIPNFVTKIGNGAFQGCSALTSVNIPNALTDIDTHVFYGCSGLTNIIIPNSVTSIGYVAFGSCPNLTSVMVLKNEPPVCNTSAFSNIAGATLYVPSGSEEVYGRTSPWNTFQKIQESITISMSSAGISTYCCPYDLDFSNVTGLQAYIVSSFNKSTNTLTLTPVTKVPAGEGLLLKGAEGDYEVPFTTTTASYTNLLIGVTTPTNISPINGSETNFILASGKHGIGFYTLSESGILAAGKAYLHLPTSDVSSSRPLTLVYENEPSGIEGISEVEEADRQYFDLQGRRIAQPTKGLYVVNGKKVIIK